MSMGDFNTNFDSEIKVDTIKWVAEQMPGGFFLYKAELPGEILYINKSALRIFGCNNPDEFRELTGNTFQGLVFPEDFDKIQDSIDFQIQTDQENKLDHVIYRIIRRDEEIRWIDDYGRFAHLPGYGDVYYVFINDITDSRMIDHERELNHLLSDALRESEAANKAKTSFLSNMSHEIRTPITTILGLNEIIHRETKDEEILSYSEKIRRAGTSLLGIISDILDFSKIESGKLELVNVKYTLWDMIADLYNNIQFRAEDKGLGINLEIDPRLPSKLIGDDLRLKQIITNLLTNSIKYTEKGYVTLRMELINANSKSADIKISVSDTGIGIKKEAMDKLFGAFNRLDTRRTHTIEGTGLGLSISQQLARMMNSNIEVSSVYDKGSTFSFVIAQAIADPDPIGSFTLEGQKNATMSGTGGFHFRAPESRILLVDDTPMNLEVIEGLLKPTKMQIDTALSGAEAIKKISIYPYDLVFLDYRMPQMDGIETLSEIMKKLPEKYDSTPIVALTANAVTGERERMLDAGFTDYITKPINLPNMQDMLLKYLPDNKVVETTDEEEEAEDMSELLDQLPDAIFDIDWLDPTEGLEYCGTPELYIKGLELYTKKIDDNAARIASLAEDKNIKDFTIAVHALKATSRTIGAFDFSERARALELAGKRGDEELILRDTPLFLQDYKAQKPELLKVVSTD